ncbi:MFS transporter [Uliginosibacterium gangwonense]|uniref:MFS transporter n=1 Tax=Uliginosibacterium gangwonense TaxID=392736 RepID=UPI00036C7547|nr:MFS transporter [Uliginosibacterium gangwonense]
MNPNTSSTLSPTGLWVLLAGMLLPQIDFSIVNVALDSMAQSLQASPLQLALMIALYGLTYAVGLALGGRLGDRYGRRRVFLYGVAVFGLASLLCGVANSMGMLLAARALQGVGAALIAPQVLATIHLCLQGQAHSRAVGYYGAMGGLSFVFGQVVGGALVSADIAGMGWRSVFLINIPVALFLLAYAPRVVPETHSTQARSVDWPGTVLLALFVLSLLTPPVLGPVTQWSWPSFVILAAAPVLLLLLWRVELLQDARGKAPLLPPALFAIRSIRMGLSVAAPFFACWSGFMFTLALAMQSGAGLSPLQSGNAFIALGLAYFVGAMLSGRVAARLENRLMLALGCAIQMTGLIALVLSLRAIWPHPGILALMPSTILIGFGQSFIVSSIYRIGLSAVPAHHAGSASAVLNTVLQAAMGIGAAFMGMIFSQVLHHTGDYLQAICGVLLVEFGVMSLVVMRTLAYRPRLAACPSAG